LNEARQSLEAAAAQLPTDATVLEHLADIYLALGLAEDADAAYRQVLALDPENEGVRGKLLAPPGSGDSQRK
jgi:Flp pilus assembly protein TadD